MRWLAPAVLLITACKSPLDGCRTVSIAENDSEVRCPGISASYSVNPPNPEGDAPAAARATFQLGGQGRETTRRDRPSPNGRIAEYRFSAERAGRTWYLGCASRDDGQLPTARCKPIFEHLLAQGTAGIPPEPDEGTRAAPTPLGIRLRLPAGCRVSTFAGGDGNVLCDDKSTALWLKIDAELFGDPIDPTTEAVRKSVPAPLSWTQSEARCTLAGETARCRDLVLVGGAHPLRARMASASVNGATRLVQCMILNDGDGAGQICAQLVQR